METMAGIMKRLRENPPKSFSGYKVLACADYQISKRKDFRSGGEADISLPTSNVLEYDLENNLKVIVRPSGTEPKIKFYYGVKGTSLDDAEVKSKAVGDELMGMVDKMM